MYVYVMCVICIFSCARVYMLVYSIHTIYSTYKSIYFSKVLYIVCVEYSIYNILY